MAPGRHDPAGAVGLIVNPASGKDVRRLVGPAPVVTHMEKVALVRRLAAGLVGAGVERVVHLPDAGGVAAQAFDRQAGLVVTPLDMEAEGSAADSTRAASLMAGAGVGCIVTVGGDGTNRAVAAAGVAIPIVALAAGTNNVFPAMVEATAAGFAAGLVARNEVSLSEVAMRAKRVEVTVDGREDFALVDAAACSEAFPGARAIWDPSTVRALVLAVAVPWAAGLSSIGGSLVPVAPADPWGLYVEIGPGRGTTAILGPGLAREVSVGAVRRLDLGEEVTLPGGRTLALDGEREIVVMDRVRARVTASGPLVVDVRRALRAAAEARGRDA